MQIMPGTASLYGRDSTTSIKDNVALGVKYLKWLNLRFITSVPDDNERIKFVLAAYNVGLGHVFDARKLAAKYHKDPNKWAIVEFYLLNKSKPGYYKDPVVEFGYCNGGQPTRYVAEVLNRYRHYKNIVGRE
jgi:membrane-bound lytic murein transglycosylase F